MFFSSLRVYCVTIIAVIIVRVIFIRSFLFYCLLLNHSFPTNPNMITNCFKLFSQFTTLQTTFAPAFAILILNTGSSAHSIFQQQIMLCVIDACSPPDAPSKSKRKRNHHASQGKAKNNTSRETPTYGNTRTDLVSILSERERASRMEAL